MKNFTAPIISKINVDQSSVGNMGQKRLSSGTHLSMRLWQDEQPNQSKPETWHDYETVGYVIQGRAKLRLQGKKVLLEPGDSWVVPKGARHSYTILEPFTAVEATCPPIEAQHSK
ncbi:MAG: cupin domain-containing protein [Thermosynechococcaceae cyanobacterium]